MKFGVPWSLKGIRPETRETAEEAARRSGMALGEWLNSALNHIEHRMAVLSDALAERTQNGGAVPPRLEALVESLANKIEQIQARTATAMP